MYYIIGGIIVWIVLMWLYSRFGSFLKDSDQDIERMIEQEGEKK